MNKSTVAELLNNILGGDWFFDIIEQQYEDFDSDEVLSQKDARKLLVEKGMVWINNS